MQNQIAKQIEDYAAARGLAPATVTSRAVGNSRLYRHLAAGGDCTTRIAQRLRDYMDSHPPVAHNATGDAA